MLGHEIIKDLKKENLDLFLKYNHMTVRKESFYFIERGNLRRKQFNIFTST
jgi:hypothetical protein